MPNYLCSLFFSNSKEKYDEIFFKSQSIFGFEPEVMDIYVNNETGLLSDLKYSPDGLGDYLRKIPSSIGIKSKPYDELPGYFWFKRKIIPEYDIYHVAWFNDNLNFILNSKFFHNLLTDDGFIYGFCCNSEDMQDQSTENVRYLQNKFPDLTIKVKKNARGFLVADTSENWGRSIYAGGIDFMAAPNMWFGKVFFEIISKDKLLSFPLASQIQSDNTAIVQIKLFDMYVNPVNEENRKQQKEFWKFFDYQNVIDRFKNKREEEIGITDFSKSLASGNKEKKKRSWPW